MNKELILIYNKSEIGAGTRGASLGVDALIMEAIKKDNTFFKETPFQSIKHRNDVLTKPTKYKRAKYIDALIPVYQSICDKVCHEILKEKFPIIISGDHASAGGSIAGIKKAYPNKRLGIIWIDAHADLHSPYTTPTGNVHGMPLATVINEDNLTFRNGNIKKDTMQKWDRLKNIGNISPKAAPEDIVFIGVRDTEKEEGYLMEHYGIVNYTPNLLRKKGVTNVIDEIKNKILDKCDMIYVTFDVDSLDCDLVSMGTGTPVKNGLLVDEVKQLLKEFITWDKTISLEVTEINPLLDNKGNKMAETTLEILEYALKK